MGASEHSIIRLMGGSRFVLFAVFSVLVTVDLHALPVAVILPFLFWHNVIVLLLFWHNVIVLLLF